MNYTEKKTLFIMSSASSEGYIEFFNAARLEFLTVIDRYIRFDTFEGYKYNLDCTNNDNALHNLPLILDAMSTAYDEDPKSVLKINEIDGIKGTDGILSGGYNGTDELVDAGGK